MALSVLTDFGSFQNSRFAFLIVPLLVVTVFCFGYVTEQGYDVQHASASSNQQHTVPKPQPSGIPRQLLDEQVHLEALPVANSDTSAVAAPQAGSTVNAVYNQAVDADGQALDNSNAVSGQPAASPVRHYYPISLKMLLSL